MNIKDYSQQIEAKYLEVTSMVKDLITEIDNSNNGHKEDSEIHIKATGELTKFEQKLNEDIQDLKTHSEWNEFTIALYGETNAGKSTIIETLRIMFGEMTKQQEHAEFEKIAEKIGYSGGTVENNAAEFERLKDEISRQATELENIKRKYIAQTQERSEIKSSIEAAITQEKQSFTFMQKIVHLFKKTKSEHELRQHIKDDNSSQQAHQQKIDTTQQGIDTLQTKLANLELRIAELNINLSELMPYSDGRIIGDGSPDWTTELKKYSFEYQGQKFAILDVPGIEGNESKVKEQIDQAVKKAHAVFYITPKAKTPESVDAKQGTIEKIKAHLQRQTEVYTIFNKKITNPISLTAENIVNDDERKSLDDLDAELIKQLGDGYQAPCRGVSAVPAFLAVAKHLAPVSDGNNFYSKQKKFIEKFSADELIAKSGFGELKHFIGSEICQNHEQKIIDSSINKLKFIISNGIDILTEYHGRYQKTEKELNQLYKSSSDQIDGLIDEIIHKLRSGARNIISQEESKLRKELYDFIASNVDNDKVKSSIEDKSERFGEMVGEEFKSLLKTESSDFIDELKEVVERFTKHSDGIFDRNVRNNDLLSDINLSFEFNFDNGIDKAKLASALVVLGIFLMSNPVGWTVGFVLGIVARLFAVGKAIRNWLSDDYKMTEQRKQVDKFLSASCSKISSRLDESIENMTDEFSKFGDIVKNHMSLRKNNIQRMCDKFAQAKLELGTLLTKI